MYVLFSCLDVHRVLHGFTAMSEQNLYITVNELGVYSYCISIHIKRACTIEPVSDAVGIVQLLI